MRILVISNQYPPHFIGGYELGCRDVVESLKRRGHQVKVLTSTYGVGKPETDGETYRWLMFDPDWKLPGAVKPVAKALASEQVAGVFAREVNNQGAFRRLCAGFKPDVVYAWNMRQVSMSPAFIAQNLGLPVCYFVSDNWLSCWENDAWFWFCDYQPRQAAGRLRKALLRSAARGLGLTWLSRDLDLRRTQFASRYLRQYALQAGKPVGEAEVIHWGIDVERYPYRKASPGPKRLLYVGQIAPHKGVHTVVEALKIVVEEQGSESATLTIAGGGVWPDYEASIRDLVRTLGLEANVRFTGVLPREALIPVYQEHDILVFSSIYDEPFGITPLEGMASGLALVSTATGGSPEIMEDEVNALIFPKEDARACAAQIGRLLKDEAFFQTIRRNGRCTVEKSFTFEGMVDKIESSLHQAVT